MSRCDELDKQFLLTYTSIGYDGLRHLYHAWFATEVQMREFIKGLQKKDVELEIDQAIEILKYRKLNL